MKIVFKRKANMALQDIIPQKAISHWEKRDKNTQVSVFYPEYLDFLHSAMWKKQRVTVTIEWESKTNFNEKGEQ